MNNLGKFNILLLIPSALLGIFLGFLFVNHQKSPANFQSLASSETAPSASPTSTPTPAIGLPQTLSIPQIGINAPVESVGLDSERKMDVPKNIYDVAWYKLGAKPGEIGNAVIDGHLDGPQGQIAIFWNLNKLKAGDLIYITDSFGQKYTFKITEVANYPFSTFPLQEVFGQTSKTRLNLITCSGAYDHTAHNYTERTVVYSERVS